MLSRSRKHHRPGTVLPWFARERFHLQESKMRPHWFPTPLVRDPIGSRSLRKSWRSGSFYASQRTSLFPRWMAFAWSFAKLPDAISWPRQEERTHPDPQTIGFRGPFLGRQARLHDPGREDLAHPKPARRGNLPGFAFSNPSPRRHQPRRMGDGQIGPRGRELDAALRGCEGKTTRWVSKERYPPYRLESAIHGVLYNCA